MSKAMGNESRENHRGKLFDGGAQFLLGSSFCLRESSSVPGSAR